MGKDKGVPNKMRKISSTVYGRKILFEKILSEQLGSCRYKIEAFYEWKRREQVFSLTFKNEREVCLGINIGFQKDLIFNGSENAAELSVLYRSYFIVNYIRCLEGAKIAAPSAYFAGLVTLEAINTLNSDKKTVSFSPISEKLFKIKPIDVHCALGSLNAIIINHTNLLSQELKRRCGAMADELISYTQLPEIEYKGHKKTVYSFSEDLLALKNLAASKPDILKEYPLLSQNGIDSVEDITVSQLIEKSEQNSNLFWAGIAIRLLAFTQKGAADDNLLALFCVKKSVADFWGCSVTYFKEHKNTYNKLLADNMTAIKRIAANMDKVFYKADAFEYGALHYIQ